MSDGMLSDAIEALQFVRQGTIGEATNIPEEHWDYRPHPNAKSVSELVGHIIEATLMLVGEATDPEGDFTRRPPPEHVAAHAAGFATAGSRSELLESLESSHRHTVELIRSADAEHWAGDIKRFDGATWKRLTYLFYAGEHESYHRGQLAMHARAIGLVPALTQRIHGDAAK